MAKLNADTLNLTEQVIRTNKVQKTHKGGRTMGWNVLVAVGDYEGHVGVGLGKARAIPDAIRKGVEAAKKNIMEIPLVGNTVPHEVLAHWGASEVLIKPASPGTGVVAGGAVRPILELAGVKDVLAKSLGSRNAINTAWATIECLKKFRRAEDVSEARGVSVEEMVPWMIREMKGAGGQTGSEAEAAETTEAPAEDGPAEDSGAAEGGAEAEVTGEGNAEDQA